MARPFRETPILFGEDARRFEARMKEKRRETPEARKRRLENYETVKKWFEAGEEDRRKGILPPCIIQIPKDNV